ncbi:hypothetical protein CAEBREN_08809 [Caenorhabditis brenneri]|uniref:Uncharacterized protein n=1 Tax=Caenorhabditis brenneri TaxID=135651 RepID=G0NFD8_CAEBE|nr:hypothetical protein CAEBREN_08809 [Caenorhabditis brenneri]
MTSKPSQVYNFVDMLNASNNSNSAAKNLKRSSGSSLPVGGQSNPKAPSRALRPRNGTVNYAESEETEEKKGQVFTSKNRPTYADKTAGRLPAATGQEWQQSGGRRGAATAARDAKTPVVPKVAAPVVSKATRTVAASKAAGTSRGSGIAENQGTGRAGEASKTLKAPRAAAFQKGAGGSEGSAIPRDQRTEGPVGVSKTSRVRRLAGVSKEAGGYGGPGLQEGTEEATRATKPERAQRRGASKAPTVAPSGATARAPEASKSSKTPRSLRVRKAPEAVEAARPPRAPRAAKGKEATNMEENDEVDQATADLSDLLFGDSFDTSDEEVDLAMEDQKAIEIKKKLREEFALMTPRQQRLTNMHKSSDEEEQTPGAKKERRKLEKSTRQERLLSMKYIGQHVDLDKPMAPFEMTFGTGEFQFEETTKTPKRTRKAQKPSTPSSKKPRQPGSRVAPPVFSSTPKPEDTKTPPPSLMVSPIREDSPPPMDRRPEPSENKKAAVEDPRSPSQSPAMRTPPREVLGNESDLETEEERNERRQEEIIKIEKKLLWEKVYERGDNGRKRLELNDLQDVHEEAPKLWEAIERDNQLDKYGFQRAPLDDILEWPDFPAFGNDFKCQDNVRKLVNWRYPGLLPESS